MKRFSLFIIIVFSFLLLNDNIYSFENNLSFTIQIGSFKNLSLAEKIYNSVLKYLDKEELAYLRIEKVKGYYTVRLGKFKEKVLAKKLLRKIKKRYKDAILLSAYIIEKRIVRLYTDSFIKEETVEEKEIVKKKREMVEKSVKKPLTKEIAYPKEFVSPQELTQIVRKLMDSGQFTKAMALLDIGLDKWSTDAELFWLYGSVLMKMNRPSDAYEYFSQAVNLAPTEADYHNGLGYSLLYLGKVFNAISEFSKAIVIDPEHVDALAGLVIAYTEAGMNDIAQEYYERLKALDPEAANSIYMVMGGK